MIRRPEFAPGSVWLAGAGPGDSALLTLATLHTIETADIIPHDALVSPESRSLVPAATRLVPAAKRAGGAQTPQFAISAELIALAKQRLRVLSLKGGDPLCMNDPSATSVHPGRVSADSNRGRPA